MIILVRSSPGGFHHDAMFSPLKPQGYDILREIKIDPGRFRYGSENSMSTKSGLICRVYVNLDKSKV